VAAAVLLLMVVVALAVVVVPASGELPTLAAVEEAGTALPEVQAVPES